MIWEVSFSVYEVLTLKLNIETGLNHWLHVIKRQMGNLIIFLESRWLFQKYPKIIMNSCKTHAILITLQPRSYFCCHAIFPRVGETRAAGVRKAKFTKIPSVIDSWDQEGFMNNDVLFKVTCYIHWNNPEYTNPKKSFQWLQIFH